MIRFTLIYNVTKYLISINILEIKIYKGKFIVIKLYKQYI